MSYADFLRPGKLAQAGVQGADVLLAQIQRLSGFPEVFWHLSEIMLMALAWVVTLVAFFVLAIMLFLAVIEFKLTTLKGFILVPFALWRGTSFIAEPVLGQIITSGVRILVFAVVTGIGTQIFSQILPSNPAAELSLQDALTVLLASMTVGGPRSLRTEDRRGHRLRRAAARARCCGGAGGRRWRRVAARRCRTGGSGARRCRRSRLGRIARRWCSHCLCPGKCCRGRRGSGGCRWRPRRRGSCRCLGRNGSGVRAAGGRVADGVADRFAAGERDGWTATGGSAIGEAAESAGRAQASRAPGWAQQLRREQVLRGVERIAREGEAGGAGTQADPPRR